MARTTDITDASSWRFFDGEDFSLANVNPYTQEISNPASHLPPPIENYYPLNFNPNNLPVEGLIYSSYFQKYISIRTRSFSIAPEVTPGIYYYLSEDGFNWELNLPNTPTTAPKLAGVVNDSLVVPILLEIPDITESTTLSETLGLELWYERIRNGESQRIDSLVRIPLVIQVDVISVSNEWLGDTPSEIVLYQNYPNPFNPSTQIRFALPSSKHVQLSVYNVSGQMVVELINGQMPAGVHHINFDAQGLSSGTYIYQLKSSDGVLSKKLLLIK